MASQTDIATTGITALPPELITNIIDFTHPPSLVPFARSCRFLAECSRDALKNHKAAHEYRVVSDVQPTTIPALLRKVLVDPVTAWHVRELEICYGRTSWNSWDGPFDFGNEEGGRRRGMPPPPDYAFSTDERVVVLDLLRKHVMFREEDINGARDDLEKGIDAPLQLVIFALCPNVRSLKLSRRIGTMGRNAFELQDPLSPRRGPRSILDYLQRAIILLVENGNPTWPVGFSSLTDLAVGVESGGEVDELTDSVSAHLFADLMHLPGLTTVYVYGLRQEINDIIIDDHEGGLAPYNVNERSSSIQHIFLDYAHGLSTKFRSAMISGCKALKSLTIHNSEMDDIDTLVASAAQSHGGSMDTLMFYQTRQLHGYRCSVFRPEEVKDFDGLKILYINLSDCQLDAFYECSDEERGNGNNTNDEFFVNFFMNESFPESLEALVVGCNYRGEVLESDMEQIDLAVATMIETMHGVEYSDDGEGEETASRKSFDKQFSNLKTVYLAGLEDFDPDRAWNEPLPPVRKRRWFSKAIAAGRKSGVDVHTRTTRGELRHQIDFPKPPSVADLKSAPEPPATPLLFDIYTGRWGPEGCGNCGSCEPCLQMYDASVWKAIEEEEMQ